MPKMTEANSRFCVNCDERKLTGEFDPKWVRKGKMVCRNCSEEHAEVEKAAKEAKKDMKDRKLVVKAAIQANMKYDDAASMCDSVISKHGGIEGFCDQWVQALKHAKMSNPGSKTVLDHYDKIARLHLAVSQARPPAADVSDMSDDELDHELNQFAKRVDGLKEASG